MSVAAVNLGRSPQRPLGTFLSESSPRNQPRLIASTSTWYVLEQI
jgi:hypothetical protein